MGKEMVKTSTKAATKRTTLAKAGHRKPPAVKGKHNTTPEDRAIGREMAQLGITPEEMNKGYRQKIIHESVQADIEYTELRLRVGKSKLKLDPNGPLPKHMHMVDVYRAAGLTKAQERIV